jgi:hypothetical protein
MKSTIQINKFNQIWMFLLVALMASYSPMMAQNGKKQPKEKKVKIAKNGNSAAAIAASISGMNRSEKNSMTKCPLHNKHMGLSDNYRADASDYTSGDDYPFAYELNYRRYCNSCTRVMEKESKNILEVDKVSHRRDKHVLEHCKVHDSPLKLNSDQDKVDYEHTPSPDMPHAKQYMFREYCKVCTKVYSIQN